MSRFNTKFTLLMSYASILSQANVSAAGKTCRRSAATTLFKPASFSVRRVLGSGDLWITEYVVMTTYKEPVAHGVSIMKFRKIEVYLETLYIAAPFTPPSGRAQWVQRTGW